ncbi:hypothetical protein [Fluviicola sp.]
MILKTVEAKKLDLNQRAVLEFNPADKTMILFQGGSQTKFTKE